MWPSKGTAKKRSHKAVGLLIEVHYLIKFALSVVKNVNENWHLTVTLIKLFLFLKLNVNFLFCSHFQCENLKSNSNFSFLLLWSVNNCTSLSNFYIFGLSKSRLIRGLCSIWNWKLRSLVALDSGSLNKVISCSKKPWGD